MKAAIRVVFLLAAWVLWLASIPVSALEVTVAACGSTIPDGASGALGQDFACPAGTYCGITVGRRSSLALNGHTISGASYGVCIVHPSGRIGRVSVVGPGEITGCMVGLISMRGRLELRDLMVQNNTLDGIQGGSARVIAVNITASRNARDGITVNNRGGSFQAAGVVANDNGRDGIMVERGKGTNIIATGNGEAGMIHGRRARYSNVTVTGNTHFGMTARRIVLTDSTVTGNGVDVNGFDIGSVLRPRLVNTTCDHSVQAPTVIPWNVCSSD